jgi:hypothetical protein
MWNIKSTNLYLYKVNFSLTSLNYLQDAFVFHDETRRLEELWVSNCSRLVFPPQGRAPWQHVAPPPPPNSMFLTIWKTFTLHKKLDILHLSTKYRSLHFLFASLCRGIEEIVTGRGYVWSEKGFFHFREIAKINQICDVPVFRNLTKSVQYFRFHEIIPTISVLSKIENVH